MTKRLLQWKKGLLRYIFNGQEQDGFVSGSIKSSIPFMPDEVYTVPADTFYLTTSAYFFSKWVFFEFLLFVLKFQIRLLSLVLFHALLPMAGYLIFAAFFLSQNQFDEFLAVIMTQEGFREFYEVGFILALGSHLISWVLGYPSNKSSFIYVLQRNWMNFIRPRGAL